MKAKVIITGVSGRMGVALLEGVFADDALVLHAAIDRAGSALIGQDAGAQFGLDSGVKVASDFDGCVSWCGCVG